jgi:hypothetical protein
MQPVEDSAHTGAWKTSWQLLRDRGVEPRDPPLEGPAYDLAWVVSDILTVCEVKSLTTANQASQIRLGLGQVLDYAFTLRKRGQPSDPF